VPRFSSAEFLEFLHAVDGGLEQPCSVVLIGGAAVGLVYRSAHTTLDLDVWSASSSSFWRAVRDANHGRATQVPVQRVTIAVAPWSMEDRLESLHAGRFKRLRLFVPEAHDLALLKIARAEAHDLDAIADIHTVHALSLEVLLERYRESVTQVIGSPEMHRLNFLAAVARLFGEDEAERLERLLRSVSRRR